MSSSVPVQDRDAGLVRALGLRGMTFNTVNLVVGASIFVLPATVAGVLGPAAVAPLRDCGRHSLQPVQGGGGHERHSDCDELALRRTCEEGYDDDAREHCSRSTSRPVGAAVGG